MSQVSMIIGKKVISVDLDMRALEAAMRKDADNSQKNSLNGFFCEVAERLGIIDSKGNYIESCDRF